MTHKYLRLYKLRIYFGFIGWGWYMFGFGWETKWFLGLSIAKDKP